MKTMLRFFGIVTLVAVMPFFFAACNNGSSPGDEVSGSATYTGTFEGKAYTLEIAENANKSAYTPVKGDAYTLTIQATKGAAQTSTGTVVSIMGSVFSLKPSNSQTSFAIKVSAGSIIAISGTITLNNGDKISNVSLGDNDDSGDNNNSGNNNSSNNGSNTNSGNTSNGVYTGALTITNVAGNTTVRITTTTITNGTAFASLSGVVAAGQGSYPYLTWTGPLTGTYNVMLRLVDSPNTVKYQNGVSFTNGSGTVDWNTMTTSTATPTTIVSGSIALTNIPIGANVHMYGMFDPNPNPPSAWYGPSKFYFGYVELLSNASFSDPTAQFSIPIGWEEQKVLENDGTFHLGFEVKIEVSADKSITLQKWDDGGTITISGGKVTSVNLPVLNFDFATNTIEGTIKLNYSEVPAGIQLDMVTQTDETVGWGTITLNKISESTQSWSLEVPTVVGAPDGGYCVFYQRQGEYLNYFSPTWERITKPFSESPGIDLGSHNLDYSTHNGPSSSGSINFDGSLVITDKFIQNLGTVTSGTVSIVNDNGSPVEIADVGSITGGKLSMTLPENLPGVATPFLDTLVSGSGLTVSPNGVKYLHRYTFYVYSGTTKIGELVLKNNTNDDNLGFWYFNSPVTVTGGGYDINAKKGWNKVFLGTSLTTDMSIVPYSVWWYWNFEPEP